MDTKALRQKILDLAIHGKLVPQDPNDEPASVLLQRIREEKERLIKEGKIKKGKKSAKTSDTAHYENVPFDVPESWEWCKLEDIVSADCTLGYGIVQPMEEIPNGVPIVRPVDLTTPFVGTNGLKRIDPSISEAYKRTILKGREILFCVRASVGKVAISLPELEGANVTRGISPVRFDFDILTQYVFYLFQSKYSQNEIQKYAKGATLRQINVEDLKKLSIPLSPLTEQRRIVKEIERWFSLIDIIESGKESLKSAVKQAKAKILDLAIHGKLVPQDPTDEPASDLLHCINPKAEITSDNAQYGKIPFDVPESWEWTMLGDLFETISSKRVSKTDWQSEGIPFYRAREIVQLDKDGIADKDLFITQQLYTELKTKYGVPEDGDIMISAVGSIGSTYIVKANDVFYYKDASVLCLRNINRLNPSFFKIWLSTPFVQGQMKDNSKGTTVDTITLGKLNAYKIPLPPIAEQHRIVAKIEQLFTQLDNIEAEL